MDQNLIHEIIQLVLFSIRPVFGRCHAIRNDRQQRDEKRHRKMRQENIVAEIEQPWRCAEKNGRQNVETEMKVKIKAFAQTEQSCFVAGAGIVEDHENAGEHGNQAFLAFHVKCKQPW